MPHRLWSSRSTILISCLLIAWVVLFFLAERAINQHYLIPEYTEFERRLAEKKYQAIELQLEKNLLQLQLDTHQAAKAFGIPTNKTKPNIGTLSYLPTINLLALYDPHHTLQWHHIGSKESSLLFESQLFFEPNGVLFQWLKQSHENKGFLQTEHGVALLAKTVIDGHALIAGYLLEHVSLDKLKTETQADIHFIPNTSQAHPKDDVTGVMGNILGINNQIIPLTVYSHHELFNHASSISTWMAIVLSTLVLSAISLIYFLFFFQVKQLKRSQQKVEHLVEDRTRELLIAKDSAIQASQKEQAANKSKSVFLANMSHEIRTPMNAILNLSELSLKQEMPDKPRDYLMKIHQSASLLLGLVNDILDFSKIESGKLILETIDFELDSLLDQLALLCSARQDRPDVEIIFDIAANTPRHLRGDYTRITQVLSNLLNNALKFTLDGSITVSINTHADSTSERLWLEITLSDTGIGMPAGLLDKLFDSFTQADASTARQYGGSGLGLVICKQLCQLLGGEISLTSQEFKGTRVWVKLPLSISKHDSAPSNTIRNLHLICENLERSSLMVESLSNTAKNCHCHSQFDLYQLQLSEDDVIILDDSLSTSTVMAICAQIEHELDIDLPVFYSSNTGSMPKVLDKFSIRSLEKPLYERRLIQHLNSTEQDNTVSLNISEALRSQLADASLLLVDDDDINIQVLEDLLAPLCQEVYTSTNGRDALINLQLHSIDLVLMDIQMPIMDGIEACKAIRQQRVFDSVIIIALTASALGSDREEALSAGMNDFLSKPVHSKTLFQTLEKWFTPKTVHLDTTQIAPTPESDSNTELLALCSEQGLASCHEKLDLYRKVLNKFLARSSELEKTLVTALAQQQEAELKSALHSLKGLSASIGAQQLWQLCKDAEDTAALDAQFLTKQIQLCHQAINDFLNH